MTWIFLFIFIIYIYISNLKNHLCQHNVNFLWDSMSHLFLDQQQRVQIFRHVVKKPFSFLIGRIIFLWVVVLNFISINRTRSMWIIRWSNLRAFVCLKFFADFYPFSTVRLPNRFSWITYKKLPFSLQKPTTIIT